MDPIEQCDHDWETVDDSFTHEFGTEVIVYQKCTICGLEEECEADDPEPDEFE